MIENYFPRQIFLFLICTALGAAAAADSFLVYKRNPEFCVQDWLRLKYGLIPFFIINWFVLLFFGLILGVMSIGFSFLWYIPLFTFLTWLAMVPGSFYGIQALRLLRRQSGMAMPAMFLHGLLQFTFLLDILDTMYLSVRKLHRGKKAAIAAGILHAAGFFLLLWLIVQICAQI